jgi:hypothetical protein
MDDCWVRSGDRTGSGIPTKRAQSSGQAATQPMPQPSKFGGFPPNPVGLFIIGFLLNAAWCIGWALFLLWFERMRGA